MGLSTELTDVFCYRVIESRIIGGVLLIIMHGMVFTWELLI